MAGGSVFLLSALSAWAVYAIGVFSFQNGTIDIMEKAINSRTLPDGKALVTEFTGVWAVDELLLRLTPFFYPIVEAKSPALVLQSSNFGAALAGLWSLVLLESLRSGNRGKLLSLSFVFGLFCQTLTVGVVTPLFGVIHILTSPTASRPDRNGIAVAPRKLWVLPVSMLVGYLLPTALMMAPETTTGYLQSKQERIAFWQPWPVYVSVVQLVLGTVAGVFSSSQGSVASTRSSLRYVYSFAFGTAALAHVATWTISLASLAAPDIFNPGVLSALHPATVFLNKLPWSSARPDSLTEATLWFSQWDHLIGALGALVWSAKLWRAAHVAKTGRANVCALITKIIALGLTTGIVGAAIQLLWERDELLLGGDNAQAGEKKKARKT